MTGGLLSIVLDLDRTTNIIAKELLQTCEQRRKARLSIVSGRRPHHLVFLIDMSLNLNSRQVQPHQQLESYKVWCAWQTSLFAIPRER